MNDEKAVFVVTMVFMVALMLGMVLGASIMKSNYTGKAIEVGAAQYNSTSGCFEWKTNIVYLPLAEKHLLSKEEK